MENGESSSKTDQILKWWEADYSHLNAFNHSSLFNDRFLHEDCSVKCEHDNELKLYAE